MKFFAINSTILTVLSILFMSQANASAQEQDEQKIPTTEEMAAKEADRLAELLKLDPGQVFYVDSTLQHDYAAWKEESEKLQRSRVDNYDMYNNVRDKWMEQIDKTYRRIFTDEQWAAYLKSGAAKSQKAREKRKAKIEKASGHTSGK
ncbi:MAG: hypothetical protein ACI3ZT_02945 [Candidatus Cryptobacteroides sp.]